MSTESFDSRVPARGASALAGIAALLLTSAGCAPTAEQEGRPTETYRAGADRYAGDAYVPLLVWRSAGRPEDLAPFLLGGLSFEVETLGWPRVAKRTLHALSQLVRERWEPARADFGMVVPFERLQMTRVVGSQTDHFVVETEMAPLPESVQVIEADWVGRRYRYIQGGRPVMEMLVSRLTPALLFKTETQAISFCKGIEYSGLIAGKLNEVPIQVPVTRRLVAYMESRRREFPPPEYDDWFIDWDGLHKIETQAQRERMQNTWGYGRLAHLKIRPIAVAVPGPGGVKVHTRLGEVSLADQSEPWLLVWFGELSPLKSCSSPVGRNHPGPRGSAERGSLRRADCPLMLNLERRADELVIAPDGITLRFPERGSHVALLAPFGMRFPTPEETEAWREGLPEDVAELCRGWSRRLMKFPLTVRESYRVAPGTNRAEVRQEVEFLDLSGQWPEAKAFAPIPPAVALAMEAGFPIEVSGTVADPHYLDLYGPVMGVEGKSTYTITYPDLSGLVAEEAVATGGAGAGKLVESLHLEVEKMVRAGHLAPLFQPTGKHNEPPYYFYNPGELVYVLSQCLPYLDQKAREAAVDYLKKEMKTYPPLKTSMLPMDAGVRRERTYVSPDVVEEQSRYSSSDYYNTFIAPENLHALYVYARQTGDWDYLVKNWEDCRLAARQFMPLADWGTQFYIWQGGYTRNVLGTGSIADMNAHLSGLVAYARICRRFGIEDERQWAVYMASKIATARVGLGVLPYVFDKRGGYGKGSGEPSVFSRTMQVVRLDGLGPYFDSFSHQHQPGDFIHFVGVNEITGGLLKKYCRPEMETYMRLVEKETLWHQTWGINFITGSEETTNHPTTPYQVFRAKVWIFDEDREALMKYLDIPLCLGDLYYLQQIVDALGAGSHQMRPVPLADRPVDIPAREVASIGLTGKWRFTIDPDNAGESKRYFSTEFDDGAWALLYVPVAWEEQGYTRRQNGEMPKPYAEVRVTRQGPFNGVAWYRRKVAVPEAWKAHDVFLEMGAVDDFDITYFNGTKIGTTDINTNPDDFWRARRFYRVPPELIRFGRENVVCLQVVDINNVGGILKRPVQLVARGREGPSR